MCKRIDHRLGDLSLSDVSAYRAYLNDHPSEWGVLESLSWIPISRFYRDKGLFQLLEGEILPHLARNAVAGGRQGLRCWSIGCASGEEPYTLAILWKTALEPLFPPLRFRVLATDIDPHAIERARRGCYARSSLKELPGGWQTTAFDPGPEGFTLKAIYRELVAFDVQDVRHAAPDGVFDVVLCRYLAFTYFDDWQQRDVLARIDNTLVPGGALVIGGMESLPSGVTTLTPWREGARIYRKSPTVPPVRSSP